MFLIQIWKTNVFMCIYVLMFLNVLMFLFVLMFLCILDMFLIHCQLFYSSFYNTKRVEIFYMANITCDL